MDIRNMPAEAANYEFVVAIPNGDHYAFLGMYTDGYEAETTAFKHGGIVIHNVRIHGYQKSKRKEKYYTFNGSWSWGCWATSNEEAYDKFGEAGLDDFNIVCDRIKIEAEGDE